MPRAFDRGQLRITHDPIARIDTALPRTPAFAGGALDIFADCTNPFLAGVASLGTGATMTAQLGTGLQAFVDGLLGPLISGALANLTPQQIIAAIEALSGSLLDNPFVAGLVGLIGGASGNGILIDIVGGFQQFADALLGGFGFTNWTDIVTGITGFFGLVFNELGMGVEAVLKPIFEFLNWIFTGLATGAAPPTTGNAAADALLQPLFAFSKWAWDLFGNSVEAVLKPIFTFLHWLFHDLALGIAPPLTGNQIADALLQPLFTLFKTVWDMFAAAATGIGETAGSLLEDLFGFLSWLWNGVVGGFTGFGSTVDTVLKPAFEFLNWLFGSLFSGAIDTLKQIFTTLEGLLDSAGTLTTWVDQIPLIGPLVSAITKLSPLDGVTMDLSTLASWASGVLTGKSDIPAGQLKGLLPPGILSSIPLSNINFDTPNLLSQGDFGNAGTITAQDGWSWDSSQNHTGSGGCAKVTCNGTARRLYSNQVIKVVGGDKINLSSYVKTSGDFAGSSTCIELILVPFVGTERYTVGGNAVNVSFNTRGAATDWALATGSSGSGTAPWTVPTGVTSVRVRLSVTSAATAGSVWFDDIDLHKTGLLSGDWMTGIVGTVAADFQAVVDKVIQAIKGTVTGGTGNPLNGILTSLQSIFSTLFNIPQLPTSLISNPLLEIAVPGLQASKITSGAFTSDRIGQDAIGTYQIADDAVGTAQIAPNAVTGTEIATNAVGSTQIAADAVGTSEIATGAVTGGASGELAQNTVTSNNVSGIDGTKISTGTVNIDRIPTTAIGATINPSAGSGAQLVRVSSSPVAARSINNRNFTPDGFFTSLSTASPDILCLTTSGATGTGTRNDYAGAFKVTLDGWYLVEIAYRANIGLGDAGFTVAPVLYKGSSLTSQSVYKVGTDCHFVWLVTTSSFQRFVQSSFIVYLTANEIVRAGTDTTYGGASGAPLILGGETGTGTSGAETYFSISLLNRSFA